MGTAAAVALTLQIIEALAPDQTALAAAGKLRKPAQWLQLAQDPAGATLWGECQGSGANPYRVVADSADHGYKCSCPSRKFPCKHALALMWMYAEAPERFTSMAPVDWVSEWLGRRRRPAQREPNAGVAHAELAHARDIAQAETDARPALAGTDGTADDKVAARQRNAASASRRRVQTDLSVSHGLDELQQWLSDQLRGGIAALVADAPARCRRIASRLVDAKAANLASRLDELPARLLALPGPLRLQAALHELGQLVLLIQSWRAQPDDPDVRSAVIQAPGRDAVLADPDTLHVPGPWQVLATEIETRRDGLVSQATWLAHELEPRRFALLQDFFAASAGRRSAAFTAGQRVEATISFHPGRHPLRGLLNTAQQAAGVIPTEQQDVVEMSSDPLAAHRRHLTRLPWAQSTPLLLAAGSIGRDHEGQDWWMFADGEHDALPLHRLDADAAWRGMALQAGVVIWNGWRARVLSARTALGTAWMHG